MIPRHKWPQYQTDWTSIAGITLHNSPLTAEGFFQHMADGDENTVAHFAVDSRETRKLLPLNKGVYHTDNIVGNTQTIALMICESQADDETYFAAEQNAIALIGALKEKYDVAVYLHIEFDPRVYCPARILDTYRDRTQFMEQNGLE